MYIRVVVNINQSKLNRIYLHVYCNNEQDEILRSWIPSDVLMYENTEKLYCVEEERDPKVI